MFKSRSLIMNTLFKMKYFLIQGTVSNFAFLKLFVPGNFSKSKLSPAVSSIRYHLF